MPNWKVWPAPAPAARFNLHVFIHELAGLRSEAARYARGGGLMVQVEWRGNRQRAEAYLKRPRRSCTSRTPEIGDAPAGVACWNEGFSHVCNLKELANSGQADGRSGKRGFRSWMVHLEIHGFDFQSSSSSVVLGRTKVDVAGFAREKGKTLRIPIKCNVAGVFLSTELIVTIELIDVNHGKGEGVLVFSADQQPSDLEFSSDDDFGRLAGAKQRLPLLSRIFSQSFSLRSSYGSFRQTQPKRSGDSRVVLHREFLGEDGESAGKLNRDGGRLGRGGSLRVLLHQPAVFQAVVVGGGDSDESGNDVAAAGGCWENRTVVSRDGLLELTTEVFFASIDQCSEKADGGGACAVLVAVIADWLHRHKRRLPRREQLDELIREGSSEWRKLCERDVNRERFSDQHFDLETVMAAEVRPIATPTTYVGFFSLDKMPDGLEHLSETAMSFDAIWDHILAGAAEEKIYVTSWNDHFFILKVDKEAIFLIDTLGERLYEGCNQAYILKFGRRSAIFRREKAEEKEVEEVEDDDDDDCSPEEEIADGGGAVRGEMVCQGIGTCKEFIKGFLAAVPLRELQNDIGRGLSGEIRVHRQLQIEFHHTFSTVR